VLAASGPVAGERLVGGAVALLVGALGHAPPERAFIATPLRHAGTPVLLGLVVMFMPLAGRDRRR
jgi:hypothetical protein